MTTKTIIEHITPEEIRAYLKEKKISLYAFCLKAKTSLPPLTEVVKNNKKMKLSTWQKHVANYEAALPNYTITKKETSE